MKRPFAAKGFILALAVILIPIFMLLMGTIIQSVIHETRFSLYEMNRKKAFYMAETGLNVAYHEFSGQRFNRTTHESDGTTVTTGASLIQSTVDNVAQNSSDGWYEWTWTPGSSYSNFNGGTTNESYRYRIYFTSTYNWVIEAEGIFGSMRKKLQCIGTTETAFGYALFDDQTLGEFTRGATQTITGKVHANGDMFFRPDGSTLNLNSTEVSAAGYMYRYRDAWGRADGGGTVNISNNAGTYVTMNGKTQGYSGAGNAFDSFNANWMSSSNGALSKWTGVVQDVNLGAKHVDAPAVQSFDPGGYYDLQAGARITPTTTGTGISTKTFFNKAENHSETVKEIDMSTYTLPTNGLIYCTTPIRIVNGQKLSSGLTITSNSNIYTKGDFNKVYGTQTAYNNGTSTKVPAALMTKSRIYHLSNSWSDSDHTSASSAQTTGTDTALYTGDTANLIEINSCLVDGTPTVDEINYRDKWQGVSNSLYNPVDLKGSGYCWANSDDFLETLTSKTVKKRGSIVHLQNATMCNFSNSNYGPGVSAWTWKTMYEPPTRDYAYDTDLSDPTKQPPFAPYVSKKCYWKEVY